jgi:hypothetical protein
VPVLMVTRVHARSLACQRRYSPLSCLRRAGYPRSGWRLGARADSRLPT